MKNTHTHTAQSKIQSEYSSEGKGKPARMKERKRVNDVLSTLNHGKNVLPSKMKLYSN